MPEAATGPVQRLLRPAASLAQRLRAAPPRTALAAAAGLGAYLLAMHLTSGNRPEQFLVCGLVLGLLAWSDATRRVLAGLLPFLLVGISYDLMHITQPLVRHLKVHVAEPYHLEQALFGLRTAEGFFTPSEWFARHHWAVADFFTGLAYIVYVYWSIALAAWLALTRRDPAGRRLLARYGWTFLALNLAGFATYYLYPAAAPWYVADHGLGPPDFTVHLSPAGAGRWDALTGIPYFSAFYARSADVFGAIPSLHVAYPFLTWLYGRELGSRRLDAASLGLFLLTSFAAVYLNHHYLIDVILGVLYALAAWGVERALRRRLAAGS